MKKIFNLLFVTIFLVANFAGIKANAADYQSKWRGQSDYMTLTGGETANMWVEFVNNGGANWYKTGSNAVHLGTSHDNDRSSDFRGSIGWLNDNRIEMKQDVVKPGETARFEFQIEASNNNGVFKEYFRLVVENITWFNDEGVYWEWRVIGGSGFEEMCMSKSSVQTSVCTMPEVWMYDSKWNGQSDYVQMQVGEVREVWVEFENTGVASWVQTGEFALHLGTSHPVDRVSDFYHNSWVSSNRIKMENSNVKTGERAKFKFKIQAPDKPGIYYEYFRPVAENVSWLKDEGVFWKIDVLEANNSEPIVTPPVETPEEPIDNGNYNGQQGVNIPSGVAKVSSSGSFDVVNAYTNQLIGSVNEGTQVALDYDRQYRVWIGNTYYESPDYIQLRAKNGVILTLDSYNDTKSWGNNLNDNMFRDTIEIRYSDQTGQLWIINELSMEDYLAGVAESSNSSPSEYLKAISIAGRTYVTYHINRGGRHPENFIDLYNSVNGNGDDQVYRGYGFEIRNPNVVDAVHATAQKVVTYDGSVVVTPYFSQSDGRTRDWEEVWGSSNYPWCKSVEDPYNEGKELRGHGVGMSANGALNFASEEGKSYDWILKYYYTGIDIETVDSENRRVRVGIYKM